jgi:DNA-binding IscR family transcriptional regulator
VAPRLTRACRLGISLALCLARVDPARLREEDLAELTGSSRASVARALRQLARVRLARGTPGPRGGWRLSRPPSSVSILDVAVAFGEEEVTSLDEGSVAPMSVSPGVTSVVERLVQDVQETAAAALSQISLAQEVRRCRATDSVEGLGCRSEADSADD